MAKLVAIGDSLTQGSKSLATSETGLSFPAMVADCLGLGPGDFTTPNFKGMGGLPFNLEWMARQLEESYGGHINAFEWVAATFKIGALLDDVEDYWERGKGARPVPEQLYHNLGIWDYEVSDSYTTNARLCDAQIGEDKDEWVQPPSYGRLRIARRVLNPARLDTRLDDTQLDVARKIRERDGEIENLIVWLGANNVLGTVFTESVVETREHSPGPGSKYTLWTKGAFADEYEKLMAGIDAIDAENVFVANVPKVTILPINRGVMMNGGDLPPGEKHYDFYPRAWMPKSAFDRNRERMLKKADVEIIDARIDELNEVIEHEVSARAAAGKSWHMVDLCALVDGAAWYRNHGQPTLQLPEPIEDLDMRFLSFDEEGNRIRGGLVSLDGMHPTTCGYGLFAQAFVDVMRTVHPGIADVDFDWVRQMDSLVSAPPGTLQDIGRMMSILERHFHISRWIVLSDENGIRIR